MVDETESGEAFLGVSPIFPCHKFHSNISPHPSHSFHFIRTCNGASGVVSWHPWCSKNFTKGCFITSHPVTWLWVENIYFIFYWKIMLWYVCILYMGVCQSKFLLQDSSIHKKYCTYSPQKQYETGFWVFNVVNECILTVFFLLFIFSDTVFTMNSNIDIKHEEDPLSCSEIKAEPQVSCIFFILCFSFIEIMMWETFKYRLPSHLFLNLPFYKFKLE